MASPVLKWLTIPILALLLTAAMPGKFHPFHVSVMEINHNAADKTLEISCKIFTDDIEAVLAKNYNAKVDLINPTAKAVMDSLVKKYIFSHLQISVDGKKAAFTYIGYENEKEAAYSYIEVENIASVKKLEISNSILYDRFDDQINIIHVTVGSNRISNKVAYPNKESVFTF